MPRISKLLPIAFFAGIGLLIWRIFFPALMSFDSFVQFRQAWTGEYNDWHPPLMAIVLHGFFKLGRGIGAVTFLQCLAGMLGLRALVLATLRAFFDPAMPRRRAEGIAVAVALFLVSPLTPLPFYLATFWKDSWAAILLLWTCAVSLELVSEPPETNTIGQRWLRIASLVLLSVALGLVRHNAIVVLPVAGLVAAVALWRSSRILAVVLVVVPLLVCSATDRAIAAIFHVQPAHLERLMMVFDLAGVCALDERACQDLPYAQRHFALQGLGQRYVPGDMDRSFPHGLAVRDEDASLLKAEYLRTVRRFPGLLLRVKIEAFAPLLDPAGVRTLMYRGLDGNEFGLRLNPRFEGVRAALTRATLWAGEKNPVLRWISGVHLVWFAVNVLWVVALLVAAGRRRLVLPLLLPLSFSMSYLLATPEPDYRFLYPATLVLQVMTLAWLLQTVAVWASGRRTARS